MFDDSNDDVRELDASELEHVCGGAGSKPGGTTDGVTVFGSKLGSGTEGVDMFVSSPGIAMLGSKPGGAGDGLF
jgi:hypothetical protein